MKKLLVLLLTMTSGIWADTIVSGSSTYDKGVTPFTSDTSFDLTLSGGPISSFDVFHEYQQGAKGGFDANATNGFSFQPVPAMEASVIGVSTDFSVVVNGVTYSQGVVPNSNAVVPPDGSTFTIQITYTPLFGTNVVDMTQNSTAKGFFAISGSVSASINSVTYTDPFSGYATFSGSYTATGIPTPQLMETYTYSATTPEPSSVFEVMAGIVGLGAVGLLRRRLQV